MGGRKTVAVDVHVGRAVRTARLTMGISQTALGNELGVTFQQIQKYENGLNRIGVGRLHAIARVLEVPLTYFFEGLDGINKRQKENRHLDSIATALSTSEGVRIAVALASIKDPELRRRIANLLDEVIEDGP